MLKEVVQEAKVQSRDNELFPIEIQDRIDRAERQLAQSKDQLETWRAELSKAEDAKKEIAKEYRQNIRSLDIQEYDFD